MFKNFVRVAACILLFLLLIGCEKRTSTSPTAGPAGEEGTTGPPATTEEAAPQFQPPSEAISPENLDRLNLYATYGNGSVEDLAVSPDGKTLAVAASFGVYLYDAAAFNQLAVIENGEYAGAVAFSPDGKFLAVGSDGKVFLYKDWQDLVYGAEPVALIAYGQAAYPKGEEVETSLKATSLAFNNPATTRLEGIPPGAQLLAMVGSRALQGGGYEYLGKVFDANSGQQVCEFLFTRMYHPGVLFAPDGTLLTWGNNSPVITGIHPLSGAVETKIPADPFFLDLYQNPNAVALSPDGGTAYVAYAGAGQGLSPLQAYNTQTGQAVSLFSNEWANWMTQQFTGYWNTIDAVTTDSSGNVYFTFNGNVFGGNPQDGPPVQYQPLPDLRLTGSDHPMFDGLSSYEGRLYSWSNTNVERWKSDSPQQAEASLPFTGQIRSAWLGATDALYATSLGVVEVKQYNASPNQPEQFYAARMNRAAVFEPGGKTLALVSDAGTGLFGTEKMALMGEIPRDREAIFSVAFNPDGSQLAVGYSASTTKLYNTADRSLQTQFELGARAARIVASSMAYNPDGNLLALGIHDWLGEVPGNLRIYDLNTKTLGPSIPAHDDDILTMTFHPSGQSLLTGGLDGKLIVWKAATWTPTLTLPSERPIWASACSPDGRLCAWGDDSGAVRLISSDPFAEDPSAARTYTFKVPGRVTSIQFSPDGWTMAVTAGGKVYLFGVPPAGQTPSNPVAPTG